MARNFEIDFDIGLEITREDFDEAAYIERAMAQQDKIIEDQQK